MKDNILTGTMTNMETGETHDMEPFYMFFNNCQLNAIVKILRVNSHFFPKTPTPETDTREVQIDCRALDCQGAVFKLKLYFLPKSLDEEQKIVSEITKDKILVVSGQFSVIQKECSITLYDVEYCPLPTEISLEEIEEVFRFNGASLLKDIQNEAEQGNAIAQVNLGYMYDEAEGVPHDYSEALKWYHKAAEQGNATAQFNIGDMYKGGRGVSQDYDEAIKWFRKAAEKGQADAQLELDKMKDK